MPFTTSHPAVVLPLKKLWPGWFSLAGAMAPDLQYFLLADTTYRGISHSWPGLFTVCLPLGIVFAFAFHRLFKRQFIANLPRPLDRALSGLAVSEFRPATLREWLVLIYSMLIGALSHFFWDSFTHFDGELAQRIPWLLEQSTFLGLTRHNTRWVQHVSSALGALAVVIGVWKWKLVPPPADPKPGKSPRQKLGFWLSGGACGLAAACLAVWFYNSYYDWRLELGHHQTLAFMSFGLGSWAGFFYFACVWSLLGKRTKDS